MQPWRALFWSLYCSPHAAGLSRAWWSRVSVLSVGSCRVLRAERPTVYGTRDRETRRPPWRQVMQFWQHLVGFYGIR